MTNPDKNLLEVKNLEMTFIGTDGKLEVLDDISFSLGQQEFLCILGPSGSGKSTLLRLIAGLITPDSGSIDFCSSKATPDISLVFQQANLMPWRTVFQNIILPLELRGLDQHEAAEQTVRMISLVGLDEFAEAWPSQLSGGMAQRVAIARAFIADPDLLLLDEPFGSLDALTREKMGGELLNIWQTQRKAVIMVTHSISEALLLSDRVIVLTSRPGQIKTELKVALPRPRLEELRYTSEFQHLEKELRKEIQQD